MTPPARLTRRGLMAGVAGWTLGTTIGREARADDASGGAALGQDTSHANGRPAASAGRAPALYLSHGAPIFAINDPARIRELTSWGSALPKPSAILAITPHYASRRLEVGSTRRGVALYDLPEGIAERIPRGLGYPTPPSDALGRRVEALLSPRGTVADGSREGFDHTTWMPLKCLFPQADVPVLEFAYPYVSEAEAFAIGRQLAPLRDEGVLIFASGGMTHNLASVQFPETASAPPRWSSDFDAWAAEALTARAVDDLVDWRHKAPAWRLAHPDDGAHFRVLLVALGAALGRGGAGRLTFPVTGFEGTLSKRSVEID